MSGLPRLTRETAGLRPAAPVRLVHLGLGNFFGAHQAWYTDRAHDASAWGIAAYTGRSEHRARTLTEQGGAYTLVSRGGGGSQMRHVASLSSAHPAGDHRRWLAHLADPQVQVVTLTVTESAYRRGPDGELDLTAPDVAHDLAALTAGPTSAVLSIPGRLLAGLLLRRDQGAGAVSVVPCDNLAGNGAAVRTVVTRLAGAVDPSAASWIADQVAFVDTMVDRITPAATAADTAEVADGTGFDDRAVVVTEEFSEWYLAGGFAGARPAWESAGARFVADVAPYEQRKLWLLNGAHSLIAYAGSARGHETVADAIGDPLVRRWVEEWWDEACPYLAVDAEDTTAYRKALLVRFANPALRHLLSQIAADGSKKLLERVVPVIRRERAAGRLPRAATRVLAAWTLHLLGRGAPVADPGLDGDPALGTPTRVDDTAAAVVRLVVPELGDDAQLVAAVIELVGELDG